MMRKIIFYSILLLGVGSIFAQSSKLKRADGYYNMLAYSLAVKNYEQLVGTSLDSPQLKAKLANCYTQLGDPIKAEEMYSKLIQSGNSNPEDLYNYAQTLKRNGKYPESDAWMKKFVAAKPEDSRALEFKNSQNYLNQILQQEPHFELKNVTFNSKYSDFGAYPSADSKYAYVLTSRFDPVFTQHNWTWNQDRFLEFFGGSIETNQELSNLKRLSGKANTKYHEGPLCFNSSGTKVYFTRNNISSGKNRKDEKGIQNLKIYMADVDNSGNWSNIVEFPYNSKDYSVGHPTISKDGSTLYFVSDMPNGFGGSDIYKSSISTTGEIGKPENLGPLVNTEGKELFPWITGENQLFFSSDGHLGIGGLDVFVALQNKKGDYFKRLNLGKPVNSVSDDFAFTLGSDGIKGYVSSDRSGGIGMDDIYAINLIKPYKSSILLKGLVKDKNNAEILSNATVDLVDEDGSIVSSVQSDSTGNYNFDLESEKQYQIQVKKKNYFDNSERISTVDLDYGKDLIEQDVALEKDPGLSLYVLIKDAQTNTALKDVEVKVVETFTKESLIDIVTGSTGDASKPLPGKKIGEKISYTINLKREGYLAKSVIFTTVVKQPGLLKVHESLDLTMDKIAVGADLAKMVDLKPIYFDLGKSKIRKDAAVELDKIVKVMNEYPSMEVELGSHTDCRGSKASNEKLSNSRAVASAEYVRQRISNPFRINGKGYGESKLINDCGCEGKVKSTCSEAEHQVNRRTEFIITKM